jgi:hypothetical protein
VETVDLSIDFGRRSNRLWVAQQSTLGGAAIHFGWRSPFWIVRQTLSFRPKGGICSWPAPRRSLQHCDNRFVFNGGFSRWGQDAGRQRFFPSPSKIQHAEWNVLGHFFARSRCLHQAQIFHDFDSYKPKVIFRFVVA